GTTKRAERFNANSALRDQVPFRDHGLAHLSRILCTGDLADPHRDLLADEALELRGLGVAGGDKLKRFRPGLKVTEAARRRQPARFARNLIGRDAIAIVAVTHAHGVEFSRQHVAGIDRLAGLWRGGGLLCRSGGRREWHRQDCGKGQALGESSFRHVEDVRWCWLYSRNVR